MAAAAEGAPQLRLGRLALRRRGAEAADEEVAIKYTYLVELYTSPRHGAVPDEVRGALLQRLALHYVFAAGAEGWEPVCGIEPPPYSRHDRHGHVHHGEPALLELSPAEAQAASPALSRRRGAPAEAMTPAVEVAPSTWAGKTRGATDAIAAHFELHLQAVAFLDALVAQYDERDELLARLRTETELLFDRSAPITVRRGGWSTRRAPRTLAPSPKRC